MFGLKHGAFLMLSWGALLVTLSAVGSAQAVEVVELVVEDLSPWREPRGGWRLVGNVMLDPTNPRRLLAHPGSGILINVPMGGTRHLFSVRQYGDVEAHVEFMVPRGSNSGVYFQGRYEIQICDSWGQEKLQANSCAAIYQRWDDGRGYEGSIPNRNASRRPGEWQTLDIVFRAPRFDASKNKTANARFQRVVFNGVPIHPADVELSGPTRSAPIWKDEQPTGPLMLQGDHGPVAFRHVQVRPLAAAD
ncbi:MAG: DUF1080 domain-containing protein [Pirellulales bacterium]